METELDKAATFFRFEDLRIYLKAIDYIDWVYKKVNKFPQTGSISLSTYFYSSAQAIALHIAEGSARNKAQFIHYLKMAKSSVRECVVHSTMAAKQNLFSSADLEDSRNHLMEMTKMLGALIGSLQRSAGIVDGDDD
ncbi:MAG: four helix bundle protein [Bacteroidota bacterium]